MFTPLIKRARRSALHSQMAKLRCPACDAPARDFPDDPDDFLLCSACGAAASSDDWLGANDLLRPGQHAGPPLGTRITRVELAPESCEWRIPRTGKAGGLMLFAVIWLALTSAVSTAFFFTWASGDGFEGNLPEWALLPFFSVFWMIGLGMLYAALRAKYAAHLLQVEPYEVILKRTLFGRTKTIRITREGIRPAQLVEFYQQNDQPVHGIEIKSKSGKLRFGSALTVEEKAWLAQEISSLIAPVKLTTASPAPQSHFSILLPNSRHHGWTPAILFSLMGIGFVTVGLFFLDGGVSRSGFDGPPVLRILNQLFDEIHYSFPVIWTVMSGLIAAGGLIGLGWLISHRGQEVRLEGNEAKVAIRTLHHGRILKEQAFPRTSVTGIRAYSNGHNNGKPMKRIELHAQGKVHRLAWWADGTQADDFLAQVAAALAIGSN